MDITIYPKKLSGTANAIPSKSQAHMLLICAAFSDKQTFLHCPETNDDIEATADCLRSLGAQILRSDDGYTIMPIVETPVRATLNCRESGSTLRFLLPIVGALGVEAEFLLAGRLSQRPLSPLWEEMERMGCKLAYTDSGILRCSGKLASGEYVLAGNVSSQFITGLLLACSLMDGDSRISITGKLESKPYIDMTLHALSQFGTFINDLQIHPAGKLRSPGRIRVEGDWSNAAFFLAANALGSDIQVNGLNDRSCQGDMAVMEALDRLKNNCVIDAGDIPDLVPVLAVVAGASSGATFENIQRLRLKESDRVISTVTMLERLGVKTEITESTMTVHPGKYHGCSIDSAKDHRIAMAAAVAATVASGPVTVQDAHCVAKSYPAFWDVYKNLGGNYEQYIR